MHRSQLFRILVVLAVAVSLGRTDAAFAGAAELSSAEDSALLALDLASRGSMGAARCAVQDPGAAELAESDRVAGGIVDRGGVVTIPVYWNVITTATGGGNVSSRIPAQMAVLNAAYASSGFAFTTAGVRVVANNTWFFAELGSVEEQQMKAALRVGGPEVLNVYTTNGDVYLGWATFPTSYKRFPFYDGAVLWWAALPGTGLAGTDPDEPDGVLTYDQGDTATHEVGHWLGLPHTFAGGCSHPGDRVKDTPAEAGPQFFCAQRDSCTGPVFPGADPITNFMDYVDDVCMDHFTFEQTKRMRKQYHAFRAKKER
jgi:Pregnancy-associated plasma protein-A